MTAQITKARAVYATAEWLQPHRQRFLQDLSAQGYARCTLRIYDAAIGRICTAVERRGLGEGDLSGKKIVRLRAAVLDGVIPRAPFASSTVSSRPALQACQKRHRSW
jgi:hypothetical protein